MPRKRQRKTMQLWHVTTREAKNKRRKGSIGSERKATRGASIDWDASHAIGLTRRTLKGLRITGGVDCRESWLCIFIASENFCFALCCAAYLTGSASVQSGCGTLMMPQINCSARRSLALISSQLQHNYESQIYLTLSPGRIGNSFAFSVEIWTRYYA